MKSIHIHIIITAIIIIIITMNDHTTNSNHVKRTDQFMLIMNNKMILHLTREL